jgi:hypothetical protein
VIRKNPVSGLLEDDGLPDVQLDGAAPPLVDTTNPDVMAPPAAPPADLQNVQPGEGLAPAPAASATPPAAATIPLGSIYPARPEHTTKVETVVKGDEAKKADADLEEARRKRDEAQAADTAIKVKEAEAKAEAATMERLAQEKKAAADAYWEDQKARKVAENKAADAAAIAESAKDEKVKNEAGILVGAAKTWATVLTAIGAIGQGLAAAGSRGAQAWQDGNPIAKLYEEDRQKAQAKAKAEFEASQHYRTLKKEGRVAELEEIQDRLTIGINNQFKRDKDVINGILGERIAKLGPKAAQAAGELAKAGSAAVDATVDQENGFRYAKRIEDTRNSPTAPVGGGKLTSTEEDAAADIGTATGLIEDFKAGPKLTKDSIDKFTDNKEMVDATASPATAGGVVRNRVGRAFGAIPTGPFEGIPLEQQEQLSRIDKLRTIQQKLMTGAGVTGAEQTTYKEQFGVNFGDSAEAIQKKIDGLTRTLRERSVKAGHAAPALQARLDKVAGKSEPVTKMADSVKRMTERTGGAPAAGPTKLYKRKDGTTFRGRVNSEGKIEEVAP